MKLFFLAGLALVAFISFSACDDGREHRHDHDHGARTTTTTTEETTVQHPVSATTETQTIRSN